MTVEINIVDQTTDLKLRPWKEPFSKLTFRDIKWLYVQQFLHAYITI
jgi:hypothetical protein